MDGKQQQADNLQYYIHSAQYSNKNVWDQPSDKSDQKQTREAVNRNRCTGELGFGNIIHEL